MVLSPLSSQRTAQRRQQQQQQQQWQHPWRYFMMLFLGYILGSNQEQLLSLSLSRYLSQQQSQRQQDDTKEGAPDQINTTTVTSVWDLPPLSHSPEPVTMPVGNNNHREPPHKTDVYNPFHQYVKIFAKTTQQGQELARISANVGLPMFHSWFHFFEGYHNHMSRFRGKEHVVFMEVGVQSGGKIALLRDYIGPGLIYVGIDINEGCKKAFDTADWVNIEIGNQGDPAFWAKMKQKYPKVDIFLDDGGHTMEQQMVTIKEMLPHVQSNGIYICEDLATSWSDRFNGKPKQDVRNKDFLDNTMVGLIHKTMDYLQAGWLAGRAMRWILPNTHNNEFFDVDWWHVIPEQVKHIHYYNQMIVYEKGITYPADHVMTVGRELPLYYNSQGEYRPTNWTQVMSLVQSYTGSPWKWS